MLPCRNKFAWPNRSIFPPPKVSLMRCANEIHRGAESGLPLIHRTWAITTPSRRRSSSAVSWRIPVGIRNTRPIRPEISQGRLEALLNFQTMAAELTGLPRYRQRLHARQATAAAEAMTMSHRDSKTDATNSSFRNLPSANHRESSAAVQGARIEAVVIGNARTFEFSDKVFGARQYPGTRSARSITTAVHGKSHAAGAMVTVATDLRPHAHQAAGRIRRGHCGRQRQRFGVPLGYGGPHAAFFATR